jgi:uncharacterized protein (TIGR00730 family)
MIDLDKKMTVDINFLLSPQAEPVRKVAESLYPGYLLSCAKSGNPVEAQGMPVLDQAFMTSNRGRWARILAETLHAEYTLRHAGVDHTVVFFGSARIKEPGANGDSGSEALSHYYNDCRELARRITSWSLEQACERCPQPFMITTGGGPAIMEAGNRGASDAGGKSIGLNITLPMEQCPNPYITEEFNFDFHYFFTRKFHFTYRAKCLVAFPGGFGTFDELFEILTLIQTKKIERPCKIILYGKDFWTKSVNFDYLVETGVISPEDLNLFEVLEDVDQAYDAIIGSLKKYI